MQGVTDYGAFCAAIVLFLALSGAGNFARRTSTGKYRGSVRPVAMAATIAKILAAQGPKPGPFAQAAAPHFKAIRHAAQRSGRAAAIFHVVSRSPSN